MDAPCFKQVFFGFLFAIIAGNWSCSNEFYLPNAVHMPLLEDKHDFDVNLSSRFDNGGQFDLQTAYAPINHFEVMLNGMSSTTNYDEFKKEHRFLEAGAGIFHAFGGKKHYDKRLRAEFIGGYGVGVGKKSDGNNYRSMGRYQRKFVQPGIGIKINGLEAGYGLRLSEINFSHYSIYQSDLLTEKDILDFTTLERCLRIAAGFKGIKFGAQFTSLLVLRDEEAYKKATGFSLNRAYIDVFLSFSPWKYKTLKGINYRLNAPDSLGMNAMEFVISESPCWICIPKNAPYKDSIDFKLNGNELDYIHKSSKNICHRLQLSRNSTNLLSISLKNPSQLLSTPVNVILIDGNIKMPFYIDLSDNKRMNFYLTY